MGGAGRARKWRDGQRGTKHLSGPLAEIESKGIDSRLKLDALSHLEGFDLGGIEVVEVVHSSRYVFTALR